MRHATRYPKSAVWPYGHYRFLRQSVQSRCCQGNHDDFSAEPSAKEDLAREVGGIAVICSPVYVREWAVLPVSCPEAGRVGGRVASAVERRW